MSERSWQPVRPVRPPAAWEARAGSSTTPASASGHLGDRAAALGGHDDVDDHDDHDDHDGGEATGAARRGRRSPRQTPGSRAPGAVRRFWTRASRARRLGLTIAAVAAVTAVVAGAGLAVQPRYDEPARPAMLVDDLRGEPTTTVWRTDLTDELTPGTPDGCAYYLRVGGVDDDAIMAAQSAELSDRCGGAGGRLARVDGETGEVAWSANVATALGRAVRSVSVTPDDDGRAATLTVEVETGSTLARLDLVTGEVTDRSAAVESTDADQVTRIEGVSSSSVLVSHQPRSRFGADGTGPTTNDGDRTAFELHPLDDLDAVTWRGDEPAQATVTLFDDELYVLTTAGEGPRVIDAATGAEHPVAIDDETSGWPEQAGDHVLVAFAANDGQRLVAFSQDDPGAIGWSADLPGDASLIVSDRCVTVTATVVSGDPVVEGPRGGGGAGDGDDADAPVGRVSVTCLSPSTGETRWTTTVPVRSGQTVQSGWNPLPDSAFDQVQVSVSPSSSFGDETSTVTTFDADDGHVAFEATLPGYSAPLAQGRTTTYQLAFGVDGRSSVVAFDGHSHRELWRTSLGDAIDVGFWGPHLVVTGQDGVVRRLDDPTAVADRG
ncbi:PQQ-binding-like beta-propeller repeat protein [Frigoribacterium sp. VKM Ac-1396]|uniref:outer membrane protein assembly factor BamB family protein n=1 Tax=Frigoribacterium sp. VKM Ac-1396 TaxID=2783821 RepID=UPI00188A4E54|nr:PQQ-binding-like beta-propeller repeat protein [Frigoribacterium sp. VKM Ac-1396]MBF4600689.1 PQQ-binding-like beta-propeller repeat protein [Frigoribacterium sp. VKM Ac-1396]